MDRLILRTILGLARAAIISLRPTRRCTECILSRSRWFVGVRSSTVVVVLAWVGTNMSRVGANVRRNINILLLSRCVIVSDRSLDILFVRESRALPSQINFPWTTIFVERAIHQHISILERWVHRLINIGVAEFFTLSSAFSFHTRWLCSRIVIL